MSNLLTSMFSYDSNAVKKEPILEEDKKLPDQIIGALDKRTGIYVFKQQPRRTSLALDNMFADIIREVRS